MAESMTAAAALKKYMEQQPNGRKVTMDELKALTPQERAELGALAAKELGVTLVASA